MNILWIEIKKLIKRNIKKIIISTLVLGSIFAVGIYFLNRPTVDENDQPVSSQGKNIAYFQYYVERQEGSAFTNIEILKEYFTNEDLLLDLTNELDIPLANLFFGDERESLVQEDSTAVEEDEEAELIAANEEYFVLDIFKADPSHLYTFSVTSENNQKSLELAQYYYNLVNEDVVPFYQDKNVYILTEPKISEDQVKIDDSIEIEIISDNPIILPSIVMGYILSLILITGFMFIKTIFSKEITYAFSYLWHENHMFLVYDPNTNNMDEVEQFISKPLAHSKVIVSENELSTDIKEILSVSQIKENDVSLSDVVYQSVLEINQGSQLDEIIILVEEDRTSRKWFRKQQRLLEVYNDSFIKILQVNK